MLRHDQCLYAYCTGTVGTPFLAEKSMLAHDELFLLIGRDTLIESKQHIIEEANVGSEMQSGVIICA